MTQDTPSSGRTGIVLVQLIGSWQGTNGFRMMPGDAFDEGSATATLASVAGGNAVVLTYTWMHPDDGHQEGVLMVGSPGDDGTAVTAAWSDSWHQHPSLLELTGTLTDGRLDLSADYGGGWMWTISLEGSDPLRFTMNNVVPPGEATDDVAAGPYPVMVTELQRSSP